MKNRLIYETPDAELILVRFEENFLGSDDIQDVPTAPKYDGNYGTEHSWD